MKSNVLGDDALAFREAFQEARGSVSRSKQIRDENNGLIPPPDAWVGRRPAWKISTIRATVAKMIANAVKPECNTPRCGGRKRNKSAIHSRAGV
ncbi:MAG: hypothetical protein PHD37_00925 [Gallionellaceae bacterium]|nr:hypothetical protein [Gallionellaceae bacterium]